jgi:hypothetical protein
MPDDRSSEFVQKVTVIFVAHVIEIDQTSHHVVFKPCLRAVLRPIRGIGAHNVPSDWPKVDAVQVKIKVLKANSNVTLPKQNKS